MRAYWRKEYLFLIGDRLDLLFVVVVFYFNNDTYLRVISACVIVDDIGLPRHAAARVYRLVTIDVRTR